MSRVRLYASNGRPRKEFVDLDDIKRDLDFYRRFNSKDHYFRRWINERQYPVTRKTNAFGGYIKL